MKKLYLLYAFIISGLGLSLEGAAVPTRKKVDPGAYGNNVVFLQRYGHIRKLQDDITKLERDRDSLLTKKSLTNKSLTIAELGKLNTIEASIEKMRAEISNYVSAQHNPQSVVGMGRSVAARYNPQISSSEDGSFEPIDVFSDESSEDPDSPAAMVSRHSSYMPGSTDGNSDGVPAVPTIPANTSALPTTTTMPAQTQPVNPVLSQQTGVPAVPTMPANTSALPTSSGYNRVKSAAQSAAKAGTEVVFDFVSSAPYALYDVTMQKVKNAASAPAAIGLNAMSLLNNGYKYARNRYYMYVKDKLENPVIDNDIDRAFHGMKKVINERQIATKKQIKKFAGESEPLIEKIFECNKKYDMIEDRLKMLYRYIQQDLTPNTAPYNHQEVKGKRSLQEATEALMKKIFRVQSVGNLYIKWFEEEQSMFVQDLEMLQNALPSLLDLDAENNYAILRGFEQKMKKRKLQSRKFQHNFSGSLDIPEHIKNFPDQYQKEYETIAAEYTKMKASIAPFYEIKQFDIVL